MTLYELSEQFAQLMEAIENGEIPEEAIADTLEGLTGDFDEKADNIACIIKNELAIADRIKYESDQMYERMSAHNKRAKFLKEYLSKQMQRAGRKKIETARNCISFHPSIRTVVDNENEFVREYPDYCKQDIAYKIDKAAIRAALKSGREIKGAHLEQSQNIQIK